MPRYTFRAYISTFRKYIWKKVHVVAESEQEARERAKRMICAQYDIEEENIRGLKLKKPTQNE
jgi:hypothetical protein